MWLYCKTEEGYFHRESILNEADVTRKGFVTVNRWLRAPSLLYSNNYMWKISSTRWTEIFRGETYSAFCYSAVNEYYFCHCWLHVLYFQNWIWSNFMLCQNEKRLELFELFERSKISQCSGKLCPKSTPNASVKEIPCCINSDRRQLPLHTNVWELYSCKMIV